MDRMNSNTTGKLLASLMMVIIMVLSAIPTYSQTDRQYIRQGNRNYKAGEFGDSELAYRRAANVPKSSPDAWFNLGNSVYRQERFEDAATTFEKNAALDDNVRKQANSYYNMGNSLLSAQKIEESIEAYKRSLRLNPESMEAKYNLAYAQDLLQKQQDQENQNNDQQDGENDQSPDDQQNNDDQQQDEDGNENRDKGDEDSSREEQKQEGEQNISQEDARRLLEALAADEQDVQEKVMKNKAATGVVRTLKNW